ncbi:MAG TPA: succinylglutamate desuccinylase/aspartoacylase family protein [Stellaceae bacterium]|nr:succinylglutamate desuccinylase/aspartoacylase family protein [Stellaceae bacterium]
MRTIDHPLGTDTPGTVRQVTSHRFGQAGGRPKIYMQAGLHAGEIPGMLVLRHLLPRLEAFEAAGRIRGEIVVVPVANPIGLNQGLLHDSIGRFELHVAQNFNRHYPDLGVLAMERLDGKLTQNADENAAVIRAEMASALAEQELKTELDELRRTLLGMALDADMVLDLHCDLEALMHLYTTNTSRDWGGLMSRYIGAAVVLLSDESGGNAFDESCSTQWDRFRKRWGDQHPIPVGCQAATVELRGLADVDDRVAAADAANLADWLVAVAAVAGEAAAPGFAEGDLTPLAGADDITAPYGGVISFRESLGARLKPGDVVAELIDPLTGARRELATRTEGLLYAREDRRFVRRGTSVAQVAGATPIRFGSLLTAR